MRLLRKQHFDLILLIGGKVECSDDTTIEQSMWTVDLQDDQPEPSLLVYLKRSNCRFIESRHRSREYLPYSAKRRFATGSFTVRNSLFPLDLP